MMKIIVGFYGKVGTGKTTLASYIKEHYPASLINVDHVGHVLLDKYTKQLVLLFGKEILEINGKIDRKILSRLVFQDSKNLEKLNKFIHPLMFQEIKNQLHDFSKSDKLICVIDAALLYQIHLNKLTDLNFYIKADNDLTIKRLIDFRKWSIQKSQSVLKNQESIQYQKHDILITNNDSFVLGTKMIDFYLKTMQFLF